MEYKHKTSLLINELTDIDQWDGIEHIQELAQHVAILQSNIAQLEKDAALMKDCVDSLRFIRDTFQKDLNQGYITKDKQFCVEMAKPYLAAIDTAMEASNAKAD